MLRQLRETLTVARPRSLARMRKSLDDLVDGVRRLRRSLKEQAERQVSIELSIERTQQRAAAAIDEINETIKQLTERVSLLAMRESQLRAVAMADGAMDKAVEQLPVLCDDSRIIAHVQDAIARTPLTVDPLPYMVIRNIFPADFFDALVRGLPPYELFADRPRNKQQLKVPLAYGPYFSRTVWKFLVDVVLEHGFLPAIVQKFRKPLGEWIGREWPDLASNPLGPPMNLHSTDGRILLRGRGYRIRPHRDPKWGFITVLIYLPRPGDSESWGTNIYAVRDDEDADSIAPHWIDTDRCQLVTDVPFRGNSALVFLNSHGAHGASIPEDAEPADLQRYMYQFRIGPTRDAIETLVKMLPEHRRAAWQGKVVDYLG